MDLFLLSLPNTDPMNEDIFDSFFVFVILVFFLVLVLSLVLVTYFYS